MLFLRNPQWLPRPPDEKIKWTFSVVFFFSFPRTLDFSKPSHTFVYRRIKKITENKKGTYFFIFIFLPYENKTCNFFRETTNIIGVDLSWNNHTMAIIIHNYDGPDPSGAIIHFFGCLCVGLSRAFKEKSFVWNDLKLMWYVYKDNILDLSMAALWPTTGWAGVILCAEIAWYDL